MKKYIFLLLLLCSTYIYSQDSISCNIVCGDHTRFEVWIEYAYNQTWGHYGNINFNAIIPINNYFDIEAGVQLSSANIYTLNIQAMPHFPLSKKYHCDLYLDTRILYRAIARSKIHDFDILASLGYRQDYLSVELGAFMHMMNPMGSLFNNAYSETMTEPIAAAYMLEVFARPIDCNWNLSVRVANFTEYQIERMWEPIFSLSGRYDPTGHWRVMLRADYKPTGIFHTNTTFYSIGIRAGFAYTF